MGIFDKLLKAIGFDDESEEKIETKPIEKKKEQNINVNSKFDLKNFQEKIIEEKEYLPKTQEEIEEIARTFINGTDVNVDFSQFPEIDKMRALDFLSGIVFALNGKMEKINKTSYLLKK